MYSKNPFYSSIQCDTVKNALTMFDTLFTSLHFVSEKHLIAGSTIARPLSERAELEKLYRSLRGLSIADVADRSMLLAQVQELDRIYKQFYEQKDVHVNHPEFGLLSARYAVLSPKKPSKKPPIILIPGVSNDIDCVETLATELSLLGRKVIVIGFPESYMGTITATFADAVETHHSYEPHAEFFLAAVFELTGERKPIELWGFSTGAPIVTTMLTEKTLQKRTKDAVLLCPASVVDQSLAQLILGITQEYELLFRNVHDLPKYVLTVGREDEEEKHEKDLKKRVTKTLLRQRVCHALLDVQHARVANGGTILVVSNGRDHITKSAYVFNKDTKMLRQLQKENQQLKVLFTQDALHSDPLTNPEVFIKAIQKLQ